MDHSLRKSVVKALARYLNGNLVPVQESPSRQSPDQTLTLFG